MRPTVLLWHGFMRSPRHLAGFVRRCESAGLQVVAPRVAGPIAMNRRHTVRSVVGELAHQMGPTVVIGHSAGAALAAWSAVQLRGADSGQRLPGGCLGLVLADGTDNLVRGFAHCLPHLGGLPIHLVDADPCACNRHGALSRQVLAEHSPVIQERIFGAGHGDIERQITGDASMESRPSAVYRWVCGDSSSDLVAEQFQQQVLAHALGLFDQAA